MSNKKFFSEKLTSLPQTIRTNGKTYELMSEECHDSKLFKGWWSFKYVDKTDNPDMPIQAADKSSIYYLCAMEPSKEEAENDMLTRLNDMIEIMTKEKLKKQQENWEKLKEKKRGK